jgi:hypothetical protein
MSYMNMKAVYLYSSNIHSLHIHAHCKITAVRDSLFLEQGLHAEDGLGYVSFHFN